MSIKNDDKLIQEEGVESLSEAELGEGCRECDMLGLLSVEEMRQQLCDWLDLSLSISLFHSRIKTLNCRSSSMLLKWQRNLMHQKRRDYDSKVTPEEVSGCC
ncbi:uncharacterized protein [Euphorbia lathyris]|uniref:uncharacterized protein isoform X2 n=1 Tax=Euphorbia lathyris TaxID=212925 RepID=UPI0033140767